MQNSLNLIQEIEKFEIAWGGETLMGFLKLVMILSGYNITWLMVINYKKKNWIYLIILCIKAMLIKWGESRRVNPVKYYLYSK